MNLDETGGESKKYSRLENLCRRASARSAEDSRHKKKREANGDANAKTQIWYQALGQTCEICILQKISEKHLSNLVPSNLHTPQKNKEILESTVSNLCLGSTGFSSGNLATSACSVVKKISSAISENRTLDFPPFCLEQSAVLSERKPVSMLVVKPVSLSVAAVLALESQLEHGVPQDLPLVNVPVSLTARTDAVSRPP